MIDPRLKKLVDTIVTYSIKVRPGDRVLINAIDIPSEVACAMADRVAEAGGLPFVDVLQARVLRSLYRNASEEQAKLLGQRDLEFMKQMNCFIGIRGAHNVNETSDVPDERMKIAQTHWQTPVVRQRVSHTRWVILRWPTPAMAQLAQMSSEQFEEFFFSVCTLDYSKMRAAEEKLKARMDKTDRVRIRGPQDTDLEFSIKGIPAICCAGELNIPDGEVFTAPVRESVNGVIHYNAPSLYNGKSFDNVRFVFKNGKIVEATASDNHALNEILNTDEGARYIGEFAVGFNPYILKPMRDIIFDEKIAGSIHFTPGNAYDEASNGNQSKVHWDLVLIQRPEYGGGEIWFDNELIRKDGRFIPADLQALNPENLT